MKGLFCSKCFTIRSLAREDRKPVSCDCGNLKAWWLDGQKGVARYFADHREHGYMIGWNNQYLMGVTKLQMHYVDSTARELHDICTDAPGFHFDKSRKACWSIILGPGMSSDTAWATPEECKEVGI